MENLTTLHDLMEYLAKEHKEVLHTAKEKHFFRFELDEVLIGLKGDINYPAIILEGYDISYSDQNSDNIMKSRGSAFTVLFRLNKNDSVLDIQSLYDKAEQIGEDFIVRMRAIKEGRKSKVLRDFTLNDSPGLMISNPGERTYGMRFEINFKNSISTEPNTAVWNDL
jgi:hypothetical protein